VGYNQFGQLGTGTSFFATNVPVRSANNVVAAAAGFMYSLFVTTDGSLWTTMNVNLSVMASNVAAMAGSGCTLFAKADGTLWNADGLLSDGTTSGNDTPVAVPRLYAANVLQGDESSDCLVIGINYNATVALGNLSQTFTGGAIEVTASTTPPGLAVSLTYNGSAVAPTNVGSYTVVGTVIDPSYIGSVTNTLVILPHTLMLGNLNQVYSGYAISPTTSTTPAGSPVSLTYNGSSSTPTNAGRYTVIGTIDVAGYVVSTTNTLVITPIDPTNQMAAVGGTISLSVVAGNGTYLWLKDSRLLLGETNSTLTITNANVINSGTYCVVVDTENGMFIGPSTFVIVGEPCLLAWGLNDAGQLGDGTTNSAYLPLTVASNVVAGAAGQYHSLFLTMDGTLWAMGLNCDGQLGAVMANSTNRPVSVASNTVAVTAGGYHSLFLNAGGTLYGMGDNTAGELGNSAPVWNDPNPTPNPAASNVVAVAAGWDDSLFVKNDGTLWAMGSDYSGELGDGTSSGYTPNPIPTAVASNVVAVAAGGLHSLFVTSDKTLHAMGNNEFGQLGNGTASDSTLPITVASNVVAMAAGGYHSLFIDVNGTLWAMGNNQYGQLGDGTTDNRDLPVSVASNVVAVAAGEYYSLFVKTGGTLWAMGENCYGQLGNSTTIDSSTPVRVPRLIVANVFPADEVGHSLAIGSVQAAATLSLNASSSSSQRLTLQMTGTPGYPYVLQSATNLTPPVCWQAISTNSAGTNGEWRFTTTNSTIAPACFYRVVGQ
jgi:alpha-tubulin suppressor-like RCC1 family protein